MTMAAVPHRRWQGGQPERRGVGRGHVSGRQESRPHPQRPGVRTAQQPVKERGVLPANLREYRPGDPPNFAARLMLDLMRYANMDPKQAGKLALQTAKEVLAEMGQNPDLGKALNTARTRLGFRFEDEKSAPQGRERRGRAGKPGGSRRPVVRRLDVKKVIPDQFGKDAPLILVS